jgi:transcriptional regulator with XRE-family HTH domain
MASTKLGRLLRRLREAQGLTQRALAKRAKVTGAYIAMLETGAKRNPSLATLRALAKALGVSVEALITGGS